VPQSAGLNHGWRVEDSRTSSGKFESVAAIRPAAGEIVIEYS
jgi:hypothetical protein